MSRLMPKPNNLMAVAMVLGAGGAAINYLLRDLFATPDDAPVTSPRTCEPGPGTLTFIDASNIMSISGGVLVASGTPAAESMVHMDFNRASGRTMFIDVPSRTTVNAPRIGWGQQNKGNFHGLRYSSTTAVTLMVEETDVYAYTLGAGTHNLCFVARSTGGLVLAKLGTDTAYKLLWVTNTQATGIRSKLYFFPTLAQNLQYDNWIVYDLGGVWGQDYGIATARSQYPDPDTVMTQAADAIVEFTWTPEAAQTLTLMVRRTDDNNCLKIECDQANGTIKLFERVAGSDNELAAGKTQTWTAGTAYRVVVILDGTTVKTFVANVAKHNTTSSVEQTSTTAKVSGFTAAKGLDFVAWPRSGLSPFDYGLSAASKRILGYGDSKTYGQGDDNPPPDGKNGYLPLLVASLVVATGRGWAESPTRIVHGGYNVAELQAAVDADISAISGVVPDYILVNAGVNDTTVLPAEATWKSNYGYILDALHTKWPGAWIGCAKQFVTGNEVNCVTLNGWLDTVSSARSWAVVAFDEGDFLPGNMADSTHPNRAGYILTAAAWQSAMGY